MSAAVEPAPTWHGLVVVLASVVAACVFAVVGLGSGLGVDQPNAGDDRAQWVLWVLAAACPLGGGLAAAYLTGRSVFLAVPAVIALILVGGLAVAATT